MTHNQRFRVSAVQVRKQLLQSLLLGRCPGVHGSFAIGSQTTDIVYPDGMTVMVLAMCSNHFFGSACFDGAVCRNHIMVAAAQPTAGAMVAVDVCHAECAVRLIGGTVRNNQGDLRDEKLSQPQVTSADVVSKRFI